jgi:hypothetical protein
MTNLIHVPSHPNLKLGKQAETAPRLLHFDTIKQIAGIDTSSPSPFDYSAGMPANTGVLYNDTYGCCTAAGKYHRLQIVVFLLTGVFLTGQALQDLALDFYEKTTGFNPTAALVNGVNPTDQGGNMQDIAEYLVRVGMLRPDGTTDKFVAAFLVDPSNMQDLIYCSRECIGIDFGVTVTTNVMPQDGSPPPKVWQAGGEPVGGHDIFSPGFLADGNTKVDSWGGWFELTPGFIAANAQTAVCYVSADALKNGKTVLNLDMSGWENALADHYQQAA